MNNKTKCMLVCDTRERKVLVHEHELKDINLQIKQITTGDYVVVSPENKILAVIERKSLEDYSASMKDGRSDNKSKLTALRKQTGCRIIYIIEGPEFPAPDDYFSNIPYKFIESSIFHLMIREGVCVIRTKDSLHTAKTLANFMRSMDSLIAKSEDITGADEITPADSTSLSSEQITSLLTQKQEKSDHEVARAMWSQFPGISVESADEYMKHWSLADIICGRVPRSDITKFKLASGRAIGKKALASLTGINKLIEVRLLSNVPGISHSAAVDLTNNVPLSQLLTYSAGSLSIQKIGKLKRNLGQARAEKILHFFNYKYTPGVATSAIANIKTLELTNDIEIPDIDLNDPEVAALLDGI